MYIQHSLNFYKIGQNESTTCFHQYASTLEHAAAQIPLMDRYRADPVRSMSHFLCAAHTSILSTQRKFLLMWTRLFINRC